MLGLEGSRADVTTPAGTVELSTPLLGAGNLANVLAATAVAIAFDIPLDAIAARTGSLRPANHRGELLRLPGGVTLIDDSYNSSPAALTGALAVVRAATGSARKIAVLGEMLELGNHASSLHRECGRAAAEAGLDCLVVVGGTAVEELAAGARQGGMRPEAVVVVADREQAIAEVLNRVRPGDLVLVKGSRGIGLDAVVERLKAEFA
jgi:UDP-N-acetylmuramoyl-tripeptide--D-alanyl-D-alanine ligase